MAQDKSIVRVVGVMLLFMQLLLNGGTYAALFLEQYYHSPKDAKGYLIGLFFLCSAAISFYLWFRGLDKEVN